METEKAKLQEDAISEPTPVIPLHPALPQVYAAKVARLEEALNDPAIREEANELLRTLIERVELQPGAEGGPVRAVVRGDLAQILEVCENAAGNKKRPAAGAGGVLSVVAGAGFQPATFRL